MSQSTEEVSNCYREDNQHQQNEEKDVTQERTIQVINSLNSKSSSEVDTLYPRVELAMNKGHGLLQNPLEHTKYYTQPIIKTAKYAWNNFLPLSWLCYSVIAFNAIPLIILVGFLIATLALVLFISGTGVLLAEGFFLGIGLLFFIPVAIFLTFSALSTTFFTVSVWGTYKAAKYTFRKFGLLEKELGPNYTVTTNGVKRRFKQIDQEDEEY